MSASDRGWLRRGLVINNVNAFMEEIERHPAVEETALSTTAPGRFTGKQVMTAEDITGELKS